MTRRRETKFSIVRVAKFKIEHYFDLRHCRFERGIALQCALAKHVNLKSDPGFFDLAICFYFINFSILSFALENAVIHFCEKFFSCERGPQPIICCSVQFIMYIYLY